MTLREEKFGSVAGRQKKSLPGGAERRKELRFRLLPSSVACRRSYGAERENARNRTPPSATGFDRADPEPISPVVCPLLCCLHREVRLDGRAFVLHPDLQIHLDPKLVDLQRSGEAGSNS